MSAAPSSIACAAPWPRNGSIGWQASPSSVMRPNDQRGSGMRSSSAHLKVSSAAAMMLRTCGAKPA